MNKKQIYFAPVLESCNYAVEQGFAISSAEGGFTLGDDTNFTEENVNW